ncbi:hypothetical protein [Thauera chlorobenzoica]|uniref:Uncharacterized protein n=1 Tax=Thauera chlorobenzoica TaxID=96773 RepID=A0A1H5Z380_9RHOO|nr:hypothetical protein [Thauera chlorobenzoica]APR05655.1 hypothetical protein Tchl_2832 [Thauera chlorobenzoica]SEG30500.1 hypothetical protein SAMN05216242_13929 [Thauera chlorobenzoica]
MNKVVFVEAFFKPIGKAETIKVPTGETKKGFFGGEKEVFRKEEQWVQTGWSDREIDGQRLAKDVAAAVDKLNEQGFEVMSLTDVTSGNYSWKYETKGGPGANGGWGYGYGYGYSYTEGIIVVAKKI